MQKLLSALLLITVLCACGSRGTLEQLYHEARNQLRAEHNREAFAKAEQGLSRAIADKQQELEWQFRLLKAEVLLAQRKPIDAEKILSQSLPSPLPSGTAWQSLLARNLLLRGQASYFLNKYPQATKLLEQASAIAREVNSEALVTEIEFRQGSLLVRLSRFQEADAVLRRVMQAAKSNGDRYLEASAMGNLGYMFLSRSLYDQAIVWFTAAEQIFITLGTEDSIARAAGNLGSCYLRLGDFDRAHDQFERSQIAFAKTGNSYEQQVRLGAAGELLLETGDYPGALERLQYALKISRALNDDTWTARWLSNLARVSIALNQWGHAEAYNQEALQLKEKLPDIGSKVYSMYNAAVIAAARQQNSQAEALYRNALDEPAEDPTIILDTQRALAELYVKTARLPQADFEFRRALAAIEERSATLLKVDYRFTYLASLIRFYQDYIEFLMQTGQPERALEVAEASRSRVLQQQGGGVSPALPVRSASDYRAFSARTGATLIEYWLGTANSYLWTITPTRIRHHVLPGQWQLKPLIEAHRATVLARRNPLEAGDTGHRLYHALLEPILADAGMSRRFIIVPDAELQLLNLETLPSEDGRAFWIENATISITPSFRYLSANHAHRELQAGLLMIGDPPQVLPEYPKLDFAKEEMTSIQSAIPGTVLEGDSAKPEAYGTAQPGHFAYIHFAAHAAANALSPLDSAVILAGEADRCKLFARDIMSIPLSATLVTLSACRTAGSRNYAGEGFVGFAWAFLKAGAHNVIAGLWDVNDRTTAQLMSSLYGNIARGMSPADALRAAKLAMIHADGAQAKPFYWAPFQLYTGTYLDAGNLGKNAPRMGWGPDSAWRRANSPNARPTWLKRLCPTSRQP